jgi:hypothetical protein
MADRYTKIVLTVIAGALVYLCIVMTAFPPVQAQGSLRPGEPTGPASVVVVGWQSNQPLPVAFQRPVQVVTANEPLRITGSVTTERTAGLADRVVVVGFEHGATREKPTTMKPLIDLTVGVPVTVQPR